MNTPDDVNREFHQLAHGAPADADVRAKLDARIERRAKRKRTASLVAVAAAVVLIAGGITGTRALLTGTDDANTASPGPGGTPAVVDVPEVPLPDDTQLIRYQLKPVTSPVSATEPTGMKGPMWTSAGQGLVVGWSNASAVLASGSASDSGNGSTSGSADVTAPPPRRIVQVGYAISPSKSLHAMLSDLGETGNGDRAPDVSTRPFTVGGHAATLATVTGSDGSMGVAPFGGQWLVWQLSDGQWIHVYATASDDGASSGTASSRGTSSSGTASSRGGSGSADRAPSSELVDFASSITEEPTTLPRALGIGLTLPGLTHVTSSNNLGAVSMLAGITYLCPEGVNGFDHASGSASSSSSSGSGSADVSAPDSDTGGGSGMFGITNGQCITAAVTQAPAFAVSFTGEQVTVEGTTVTVNTKSQSAMSELGHRVRAFVSAPASAHLSQQDLAALAVSVRMSSEVHALTQQQLERLFGTASSGTASSLPAGQAGDTPHAGQGTPIRLAPDHEVTGSVDAATRTGALTVWLDNTASHPVTLTTVELQVSRLTQTPVHVDTDALADSPDAPTIGSDVNTDDPLPLTLAPGAEVPFTMAFEVTSCDALPEHRVPGLHTEYRYSGDYGSGAGGGTTSLPDGLWQGAGVGDAWVEKLTEPVCG